MNHSIDPNTTAQLAPTASFHYPVVAMTAAYCVILFIAFFGNVLVIHVVATRTHMKSTFNFLIVNMAIADLLVSLFIIPLQIKYLYIGQLWISGGFGTVSCKWVNFSGNLSIAASIVALVAISLDRYFAIVHPFKHLPIVRNTKIITSLIWFISALFMSPYLVLFDVDKSLGNQWNCRMIWTVISASVQTQFEFARSYFITTLITLYLMPLVVIAALYIRIGHKLSSRKIPGHSTANVVKKAQTSKRKVLRMLSTVVLVFTFCWLPAHLMHVAKFYEPMWFRSILQTAPTIEIVAFFLCHANSAINPFLYVTMNEKFKREFQNVMSYWFPCVKTRTDHFLLTTVASEVRD